jgi:hemerythrin-like domain-containing protein
MIQRILAYIQDYPECVHHPAEDEMFSIMLNKGISDRQFREDINMLMKDHTELEGITRDVIEAVEPMLVSTHSDITDIGNKLSTLINRQRSHLLLEEMNIYPHIAEHLGSEDWENIAALIPDFEDPIFCDKVRKEYELIFKAL